MLIANGPSTSSCSAEPVNALVFAAADVCDVVWPAVVVAATDVAPDVTEPDDAPKIDVEMITWLTCESLFEHRGHRSHRDRANIPG